MERDLDFQEAVRNDALGESRARRLPTPNRQLRPPRPK
jgi:hypothetical protein